MTSRQHLSMLVLTSSISTMVPGVSDWVSWWWYRKLFAEKWCISLSDWVVLENSHESMQGHLVSSTVSCPERKKLVLHYRKFLNSDWQPGVEKGTGSGIPGLSTGRQGGLRQPHCSHLEKKDLGLNRVERPFLLSDPWISWLLTHRTAMQEAAEPGTHGNLQLPGVP